jgi:hypothetical protein
VVQKLFRLAGYLPEVGDSTASDAGVPIPEGTTSMSDSRAISDRFRPETFAR